MQELKYVNAGASNESIWLSVPTTALTDAVMRLAHVFVPKSPAAKHATTVLELHALDTQAILSETVCVESQLAKFSPWRGTMNDPVTGPLKTETAVSTGASYVKASIFVPTEPNVNVMALCAPSPKGNRHLSDVRLVHTEVKQIVAPTDTVPEESVPPKLTPLTVTTVANTVSPNGERTSPFDV